jgi:glycosyltransferase involved in cell wall biosynthesis
MSRFNLPNDFYWRTYLKLNNDLLNNIKTKEQAIEHYFKYGIRENRQYKYIEIPDDFNWKDYLELNSDLIKLTTKEQAIYHYIKHGIKENRLYKLDHSKIPDNFDWKIYLEINPDLLQSYSENEAKKHYIKYGINEKRSYTKNVTQIPTKNVTQIPTKNVTQIPTKENKKNLFYDKKYYINNNEIVYPDISVIVPNYNNSKYLLKRLESIYNQTITPSEIIIIDDCSTDNSVKIIEKYISDKTIPTKLIINSKNTGSGYYNWIKGIKFAKYDLIWIAEADDYCDLNFIETLVKEFIDKSVSISYCKTYFVNENNNVIWKITDYLDKLWENNFKQTLAILIKNKFGYLNIIPNVSSCIFKKPSLKILEKMNKYLEQNIKLVMDWIFYLLISKNSSISYSVNTTNYYLVRDSSVSQQIQKQMNYFKEHCYIMSFIIENFNVNEKNIELLYSKLKQHCLETKQQVNILNSLYDINNFKKMIKNNKQTILIFSYGFLLGGGEIFPIHLANSLYNSDINVIYMVMNSNEVNNEIYNLLNKNIKIVNNSYNIHEIINNFNITHVNTHHQCCDSIVLNYIQNYPNSIKHFITDHGMYNIHCDETSHLLKLINKFKSNVIYINDNNFKNFKYVNTCKFKIPITIENYNNYQPIYRKDYNLEEKDFVITLASRCIKEKGWEEMIFIMNKLNEFNKNIKLLLIGDYNNHFGEYLIKNYKNKNIHFLGYQKNIKRFYEISDIGILPTYYSCESNPIVLIECLFAKKPFIVTNIGETSKMLYGKNGYAGSLINLKNGLINIEEYIIELKKYIDDKKYYNSKIVEIDEALKKFDIEEVKKKYVEIFQK